jgi:hypothetical protein
MKTTSGLIEVIAFPKSSSPTVVPAYDAAIWRWCVPELRCLEGEHLVARKSLGNGTSI